MSASLSRLAAALDAARATLAAVLPLRAGLSRWHGVFVSVCD